MRRGFGGGGGGGSGDVSSVNGATGAVVTGKRGKLLFVDSVNGNDGSGTAARAEKPFLTLAGAKAAASSGDTIVVYPGTYNERDLLKTGVNWHFMPGAKIIYTGAAVGGIWDNSPSGVSTAVTSTITGAGWFENQCQQNNDQGNPHAVILTQNTSSEIHIECDTIKETLLMNSGSNYAGAVLHMGGTLHLKANKILGNGWGIWWGDGEGHYNVSYIYGKLGAFYCSDGEYFDSDLSPITWTAGSANLTAHTLESDFNVWYSNMTNSSARVWTRCLEMINNGSGYTIGAFRGKMYIDAQKIGPPLRTVTTYAGQAPTDQATISTTSVPGGTINDSLWVRAMKVGMTGGTSGGPALQLGVLRSDMDIQEIEDANGTADQEFITCDSTTASSPRSTIRGHIATSASTSIKGFNLSGNVEVSGWTLNTLANTTAKGVTIASNTNGTPILRDMVIVTGTGEGVYAAGALNAKVYGVVNVKVAKSGNVTYTVGAESQDADVA